jgi:hypothetical protein
MLLSKLASEEHPHIHSFYEWINLIILYRIGISAARTAIAVFIDDITDFYYLSQYSNC